MDAAVEHPGTSRRRRFPRGRTILISSLLLLAASHVVRRVDPVVPELRPGQRAIELPAFVGDEPAAGQLSVALEELGPTEGAGTPARVAPVVVLVHGSPVASIAVRKIALQLARSFRVVLPDLPGLGNSTRAVPDYSVRAHGASVVALLDALGIERAHLVGYSMGGGVILEAARLAPERVASLTMLSAIGVQEFELLGDHHLNRAVHLLQLGILVGAAELLPHFGAFDAAIVGREYARNFSDTDQRPLRGILESIEAPMLILHGEADGLVPLPAALEHHRIVPQSELVRFSGGHLTPLDAPSRVIDPIVGFVHAVEAGEAPTRAGARPERIAAAQVPFDRQDWPGAAGLALLIAMLLIAGATLVSEDLACAGAGILVAQGALGFAPAAAACAVGIFVGDLGLFIAGRVLGRRVVTKAPFRWLVKPRDLAAAAAWLERRGLAVIFASRFTPGLRLPTYVAAGVLPTRFGWFAAWFAVATTVWSAGVVALATVVGRPLLDLALRVQGATGWIIAGELVVLYLVIHWLVPLCSYRGRRGVQARLARLRRSEYWPTWVFYPPLVLATMLQMIRFRSITVFACANPGIEHGGFIGESKSAILRGLASLGDAVARWTVIEPGGAAGRAEAARRFRVEHGLGWPLVLKPDVGERGSGVVIARSEAEVRAYLANHAPRTIAQEYVPGREYGVFYYRRPEDEVGRIFAITDKRVPVVVGDGARTLERLVLDDPERRPMARTILARLAGRAFEVPAAGERVVLVEIGTHALGAIFRDGSHLATPELVAEVDRLARAFEGFRFGRFDIRVPDEESFRAGRGLRIVELNGVSSEATHIYDPRFGFFSAQRVLREQWRIAYEIGAAMRARGVPAPRFRPMWRSLFTAPPRPPGDLLSRAADAAVTGPAS